MRIIGIDPGTIACGYGVVESGVKSKGSGEKKANLIKGQVKKRLTS
jgi:Holliday junction resolvasome RuvABC endonuclease subunit